MIRLPVTAYAARLVAWGKIGTVDQAALSELLVRMLYLHDAEVGNIYIPPKIVIEKKERKE